MSAEPPAIEGGRPIRTRTLPYGRQDVRDEDVDAVERILRGDWLTTGPSIAELEARLRDVTSAPHVVAVSSGTAALHAACHVLRLAPGDEVILPSLTFVASANAVVHTGATPVFADIRPDTFTLDLGHAARLVGPRTRAIMTVHYAGLAAGGDALRALARERGLRVIEDAAHALGARDGGAPVGARSDLATFSFHPVKHITTGEGGAVTAASPDDAAAARRFRNHGLTSEVRERESANTWSYDMVDLGLNYRLTDIGAALGVAQIARLADNLRRRRSLASAYRSAFDGMEELQLQAVDDVDAHAWHLFVVALRLDRLRIDRDRFVRALRAEGIAANVHYAPAHLMTYYRRRGGREGQLPVTEDVARRLVTLPLYGAMTDRDQLDVVEAVRRCVAWYRR